MPLKHHQCDNQFSCMFSVPGTSNWLSKSKPPQIPSTLTSLCLKFLDMKTKLLRLSYLKELPYLELQHCSMEKDVESLEIGQLDSLHHFRIQYCAFKAVEDLSLPRKSKELSIDKCKFLKTSLNLLHIWNLRLFFFYRNVKILKEIFGFPRLTMLSYIDIHHCKSLKKLDEALVLSLRSSYITGCEKLQHCPAGFCTRFEFLYLIREGYQRCHDYPKGG